MFGLLDTATVYTPNGTTGDFTVVAKSSLACRLTYTEPNPSQVGANRENIGSGRRLLWDADYTMPDNAQVVVNSERWNVIAGTFGALRGPNGAVVYRRCEVEKAI